MRMLSKTSRSSLSLFQDLGNKNSKFLFTPSRGAIFSKIFLPGRGFTLVEMLIVVIIIGILAIAALPAFLNQQGRARINAAQKSAMSYARACAAAQITGDEKYATPAENAAISGTCGEAGSKSIFTSKNEAFGTTKEAKAAVEINGSVILSQCAEAPAWIAGTPPSCTPLLQTN